MKLLLVALCLLNFGRAKIVEIECEGKMHLGNYDEIGEVKECRMDGVTVDEKGSIVNGSSVDLNVFAIWFLRTSQLHHLPRGLQKKFPNLKAIELGGQPMETFDQHDLEEFGDQLEFFRVSFGEIISISRDLFKYNTKIKWIEFDGNPLKFIEPGFFEALMKIDSLKSIQMSGNLCVNQDMEKKDFGTVKWEHFCNHEGKLVEEPYDDKNEEGTCGKIQISAGKIAGEEEFAHGSMPWIAAVMREVGEDKNQEFLCGGSLISRTKVVTAAHCIRNKKQASGIKESDLRILLGARNLSDPHELGRKYFGVEKINMHSDWDSNADEFDGDIAILKLLETVTYDKFIQPVCLSQNLNAIEGTSGTVAVWGAVQDEIHNINEGHSIPRKIIIPIQSTEYCREHNEELIAFAWEESFFAGRKNITVCGGDSGSGFYVKSNGTFYLKGIVSYSKGGDCVDEYLAIFSDATKSMSYNI